MNSKVHFRVCHQCGALNEQEGELVTDCECCGKHLAPFYFFDESRAMGLQDSGFDTATTLPHKEYPPVFGLTAYWES